MSQREDDTAAEVALADTFLFIAIEQNRSLSGRPPKRVTVSVVTVAELRLGVLAADSGPIRACRLETLSKVEALDPLPIDGAAAHAWAVLRLALRDQSKRMPINNSWIAAMAISRQIPVATQDDDYDDVPGLTVIKV